MRIRPHKAVEADVVEAFAYYHERSPVLAEDFLNEFDAALELLRHHPLIGAFLRAPVRRVRLHRFPYLPR